jgi:phosphogluconate dehydratase
MIRLDAHGGTLEINVDPAELRSRPRVTPPPSGFGYGRELFGWMRRDAGSAEAGASVLFEAAA